MNNTADNSEINQAFYLNSLLVDPQSGEIRADQQTEVVEPKTMALLLALCETPKEIISAEALFASVWPQSVYSPNLVRRNIALLRKVLGDSDKTILKTHPKRGYSLQADITRIENSPAGEVSPVNTTPAKPNAFTLFLLFSVIIVGIIAGVYFRSAAPKPTLLSDLTPITASETLEKYMRVSPDGRFMAIVTGNEKNQENNHIVLRDLTTGKTQQITTSPLPYRYLAWQALDAALLYSYPTADGIQFGKIVFDDAMRVVSNQPLFQRKDITWNSSFFVDNQDQLVYLANHLASEHSRGTALYQHNIASQEIVNLLPVNEQFKPYKVAMSQDKTQLAILGFNQQSITQLKLFDLASKEVKTVRDLDNNWYFLTWSSSNSLILSDGRALSEVTLAGDWVAFDKNSLHFLQYVQAFDNTLYYIEKHVDQDLWHAPITQPNAAKAIIDTNTLAWGAALSSDGEQLVYISNQAGLPQLIVKSLKTGKEQVIFSNKDKDLSLSPPIWQSSGQYIASAINNRPFIIDMTAPKHAIQWLDTIIGTPQVWLNQRHGFVYIDKSQQGDKAFIYDIQANKREAVRLNKNAKQWAVNQHDHPIANTGNTLLNTITGEVLLSQPDAKLHMFSHQTGIYYRVTKQGITTLGFYPFFEQSKVDQASLDKLCSHYCDVLEALSDQHIIFANEQQNADILSLTIKHSL